MGGRGGASNSGKLRLTVEVELGSDAHRWGRHSRMKDEEEAWWERRSATLGFLQKIEEMNLGLRLIILTKCLASGSNNRGI